MIHLPAKPGPNQQETPFGPCLSASERKLQSSSAEKHWSSRARAPPEAAAGGGWRKPPGARLPEGCAHLGHSSHRPPSVGWGRGAPDTQPFPERGGVTASRGRREGSAGGVRAAISEPPAV